MGIWADAERAEGLTRQGQIHSINVSRGGVPKTPVTDAIVAQNGLVDDAQRDRRFHGGPTRAVCLYSLEAIEALAREGHPISPGSVGENLTLSGLPWGEVTPGALLESGEVILEVTSFTAPCKTIRGSFLDGDFNRINEKKHPGWSRVYARVVRGGALRAGAAISLRPSPALPPLF